MIKVQYIPTCIWSLQDDGFACAHDLVEVVEYENMQMGFDGPYEVYSEGYACVEDGEPVEGDPAQDREEAVAENNGDER